MIALQIKRVKNGSVLIKGERSLKIPRKAIVTMPSGLFKLECSNMDAATMKALYAGLPLA